MWRNAQNKTLPVPIDNSIDRLIEKKNIGTVF
jgi:hypothetical protein